MNPSEYAQEMCRLGAALMQQADVTQEGEWMAEAIDCYHLALESDPELLDPYLVLGYLFLHNAQPEVARAFLNKALVLSPFDDQVHELLAELEAFESRADSRG